jgi:hypothetical protein
MSLEKQDEDAILNQKEEMECLRETKDIRDELKMINRILADQLKSLTTFTSSTEVRPRQTADPS